MHPARFVRSGQDSGGGNEAERAGCVGRGGAQPEVEQDGGDGVTDKAVPKFAKGDLVVNTQYAKPGDVPVLVILDSPEWYDGSHVFRYGVHYVQRPELGYPSGGSSWTTREQWFHYPTTGHEQLLALQYKARARSTAAEAEARKAAADAAAVDVALGVFLRSVSS